MNAPAHITELRRVFGAAAMAVDSFEREHGMRPTSPVIIHEYNKLLHLCADARAECLAAEQREWKQDASQHTAARHFRPTKTIRP